MLWVPFLSKYLPGNENKKCGQIHLISYFLKKGLIMTFYRGQLGLFRKARR